MRDETMTLILCAFIGVSTWFCTQQAGDESWRQATVKHGAAEWYLDGQNQKQWRWKQ